MIKIFEIEKTKDNYDILKIMKDNKSIYMGSKYNMENDINNFLKNIESDFVSKLIFVFGFGAGEHIKKLRDLYKKSKIIIFEPNSEISQFANKLDWVKRDENLNIIYNDENRFRNYTVGTIDIENVKNIKVGIFANYNKVFPKESKKFLDIIKESLNSAILDLKVKDFFSEQWFETLVKNIPYMLKSHHVDEIKDEYKNKPAIIVSAGPSLEKNIDELKKAEGKILIFTGGRNLEGLLNRNINPDLLGVIDGSYEAYEIIKDIIDKIDIPLLFLDITNENIVSNHKGEKIFTRQNAIIDYILGEKIYTLNGGGSVAHILTSFAIMLGCNPIVFIGQDLAYTNEKSYAGFSGTLGDTRSYSKMVSKDDIYVEDVNGEQIRTSILWDSFRLYFEKIIALHPEIEFINATEGGARIKGTKEMKLSDFIEKYNYGKINNLNVLLKSKKIKPIKVQHGIDSVEKLQDELSIILNKTNRALKELDELKIASINKNFNKINSIIQDLDKIDILIKEKRHEFAFIESLLQPIINKILSKSNIKGKSEENNNIDAIIEENKELYGTIRNSSQKAIEALRKLKAKIKEMYEF
ncbi:motility associated factor glycosyltransferase family protein [uncultured Clostridium sp.]|uniref:motility associated factor glycosyltransferase family protein n=1 Tax=uncultured Clostridium sp. TaxID=59620 RepID=UPI0025EEB132|nr:6-hydroxymethylpterin diphosphokinase MptE-like protein [uncultured Clostridium sp.]